MRETGLNQILVRFLLAKSPTRGLSVLKFPFSEVTPNAAIQRYRESSTHEESYEYPELHTCTNSEVRQI